MSTSLYLRLSLLQFLQFFIWGCWFVTAGTYLLENLEFTGREVGMVYATTAIAATITPFFIGLLADRFFSSEKILGVLHLVGAFLLYYLSTIQTFGHFYIVMLLYVMCFLPTFSLSNSLCFHHVADARRDFPRVRVWGTVAWIVAGLLISWLKIEAKAEPFQIAAFCSLISGAYCFTLPKTPPSPVQGKTFVQSLLDPQIRSLFKDKSFVVLTIALLLVCIPSSYYYSFVNPFLNEMNVTNAAGKMAIGQVTEIILILLMPFFFIRLRFKTIIFLGLLFWGLRYSLFIAGINWQSEALYFVALALHGLAYVFSMFSAQIYLDTKVPIHLRSTAQGFFTVLTLGFGIFVGSYIAGETVSYYTYDNGLHNWNAIWQWPTYIGTAVAIWFWLMFKNKEKA